MAQLEHLKKDKPQVSALHSRRRVFFLIARYQLDVQAMKKDLGSWNDSIKCNYEDFLTNPKIWTPWAIGILEPSICKSNHQGLQMRWNGQTKVTQIKFPCLLQLAAFYCSSLDFIGTGIHPQPEIRTLSLFPLISVTGRNMWSADFNSKFVYILDLQNLVPINYQLKIYCSFLFRRIERCEALRNKKWTLKLGIFLKVLL